MVIVGFCHLGLFQQVTQKLGNQLPKEQSGRPGKKHVQKLKLYHLLLNWTYLLSARSAGSFYLFIQNFVIHFQDFVQLVKMLLCFFEQTYVIFLARLKKPQFSPGPESSECRLFALDDIPFDSLSFSSMVVTLKLVRSFFDLQHLFNYQILSSLTFSYLLWVYDCSTLKM